MSNRTMQDLSQLQALPLHLKIELTKARIRQWINEFGENGVYISFSGGKDSTVLSHIVDQTLPENKIPRVFFNTGLEYPEIVQFVKKDPRIVMIRPKMNFKQVITRFGYPFITKEVSECVYGAKKYLNELDRQTDRQTPYSYFFRRITGTGEYAKQKNGEQGRWKQSKTCNCIGNVDKGQESSDSGEFP